MVKFSERTVQIEQVRQAGPDIFNRNRRRPAILMLIKNGDAPEGCHRLPLLMI